MIMMFSWNLPCLDTQNRLLHHPQIRLDNLRLTNLRIHNLLIDQHLDMESLPIKLEVLHLQVMDILLRIQLRPTLPHRMIGIHMSRNPGRPQLLLLKVNNLHSRRIHGKHSNPQTDIHGTVNSNKVLRHHNGKDNNKVTQHPNGKDNSNSDQQIFQRSGIIIIKHLGSKNVLRHHLHIKVLPKPKQHIIMAVVSTSWLLLLVLPQQTNLNNKNTGTIHQQAHQVVIYHIKTLPRFQLQIQVPGDFQHKPRLHLTPTSPPNKRQRSNPKQDLEHNNNIHTLNPLSPHTYLRHQVKHPLPSHLTKSLKRRRTQWERANNPIIVVLLNHRQRICLRDQGAPVIGMRV